MTARTNAGTAIAIGTTQTSSLTDVFTTIGEVISIGDFGRVYDEIAFSALDNRNVQKYKGQRNDGNIEIEMAYDPADTGQDALLTALDSDSDYNFRITLNDASGTSGSHGTLFHFKAKVMSAPRRFGDANNIIRLVVTLGIKSGSITLTEAT